MTEIDPVTQEILRHALSGIAEEMAVVEYRSSFSPIIREMLDFSCGTFDRRGRMLSHAEQIPAQLGLMQFALAACLGKYGRLEPGDVVILNHPYRGGTHTPDLQLFMPAYVGDRLVGHTGSIAHHADVGGRVPGTESADNSELFQEGLLLPPLKLLSRGERNEALFDVIAANVRDPDSTLGDLAAQIAACRRGCDRLVELCRRHGADTVERAMEALLEQTSQRTRAELATWPSRAVEAKGFLDDDGIHPGEPVCIAVRVEVGDGELHVDFAGSSPEVAGGVNAPWASTHAGVYFAVRCFLGTEIPQNDGLTRHIVVDAEEGTVVRPRFPAAVSARHLTVQRIAEVACAALGELLPDRAVAASHTSFPAFIFKATDPRTGRRTLLMDILGGGGGARQLARGDHAIDTYTSSCAILPAEIAELEYPWLIERTELVEGSGGEGAHPGGWGIRRDYRLLADEAEGPYYVEQTNPAFAARGWAGGQPGAPARVSVYRVDGREEEIPSKGYLHLRRGDVVSFVSAGGGGFGRPER
ncbi:MAG: hydantoinase B/oxoprolinase family protein [Actinomycetota bacterium]|nr:hydantoinase B/oxoprolinase family protein [Actinomycetota bacterium]